MNIFSGIVVFVIIWWAVFFCLLPFGVRHNEERPKDGTAYGAPLEHGLKKKLLFTTLITIALWGVAYLIITSSLLSFSAAAAKM